MKQEALRRTRRRAFSFWGQKLLPRDDVQIVTERLVDKIDPPRFFPLVGPAQLHHCHWKATIYYTEVIESGYPFPVKIKRPRIQVVYIDKDHLHLYAGTPELQKSFTKDLAGY